MTRNERELLAKSGGSLADRAFSDTCRRLGLDRIEALRAPLHSVVEAETEKMTTE